MPSLSRSPWMSPASVALLVTAQSCAGIDDSKLALPAADAVLVEASTTAFHRHSPDGTRVAYFERERSVEYPAHEIVDYALVVATSKGSERQVLTPHDSRLYRSFPPAWAPDGKSFACTRQATDELTAHLEWVRCTGATWEWSVIESVPSPSSNPAWSPDGELLAVVNLSERENNSYRWILHVVDPVSGDERLRCEVPHESFWEPVVSWTPDGGSIVLVASQALFLCELTNKGLVPRRIAPVPYGESTNADAPQWSAGGEHMALVAGTNAYLFEPSTEACTQIFPGREVAGLTWVPNSEVLLMVEKREGVPGTAARVKLLLETVQTAGHAPNRSLHIPWFFNVATGDERELEAQAWFEDHGVIPIERMSPSVRQAFSRWSR